MSRYIKSVWRSHYCLEFHDVIEKMEFDEEITPYLKIFNDDILANIDPIVLDNSFKEVYLKYKNRDFKEYLKPYLEAIIEYYEVF